MIKTTSILFSELSEVNKKVKYCSIEIFGKNNIYYIYQCQYDVMMPSVNLKREVAKYLRVEEQTAEIIATAGQAQGLRLNKVNYPPAEARGLS